MIYERIKELCKKNCISVNELESRIGVARGSLCKIDKHKPSLDKIQRIANELNSSVAYIMDGNISNLSVEMADIDTELIFMPLEMKRYALKLASLPDDKREQIMSLIDMLSK
ncbi:MAG: helix-turn-helix transcriptional regulator [Bacteroidaceae bacterium]|nr:helix-turn-helix transcriptional regulator [Bacteroidaceae bacterium]